MVQLLSCSRGHFWEAGAADNGAAVQPACCPVCGGSADTLPLLAPAEEPAPVPPLAEPLPLRDAAGHPVVAGYEILEDLGRGPTGMLHFKAKQQLVNRTVLLRVVFARDDSGQAAWGSLRGEATTLGKLPHPNVVQVHEAGERDRQLFYNAVEWVEGRTLAERLAEGPFPPKQVALLVEMLARAVHFAHERGVVHRCLKPASVLLQTLSDDETRGGKTKPGGPVPPFCQLGDDFCLPRLTDFGLHRRPVEGDVNDVQLQHGLPYYLAPEQAWGRAKEIGPSCDVYALGAILFHLLSGVPPFQGGTNAFEVVERIQTKEAPLPQTVARGPFRALARSAGDLQLICRKCLRKEPRRRYATALALAEDLRRYALGQPVKAAQVGGTNAHRFGGWLRRRARRVLLVLLVLGLCVAVPVVYAVYTASQKRPGGTVSPVYQAMQNRQNQLQIAHLRESLEKAERRSAVADYARRLAVAQRDGSPEALGAIPEDQRLWEFHYLHNQLQKQPTSSRLGSCPYPILSLAFGPGWNHVAVGSGADDKGKGEVVVWNATTGQEEIRLQDFGGPVRGVSFRPEAINDNPFAPSQLATASYRTGLNAGIGEVAAWTIAERFRRADPWDKQQFFQQPICSVAYAPDGRHFLSLDRRGTLRRHLADGGQVLETVTNTVPQPWRHKYSKDLPLVVLNRDGSLAAAVGPDGEGLYVYRLSTPPTALAGHTDLITGLAVHVQGDRLASCSRDGTVRVWNSVSHQELHVLKGHRGPVLAVAFSPDGKRLASCGEDNTIRLWDAETGMEVFSLPTLDKETRTLAFGPDGRQLAVAHGKEVTLLGGRP